MIGESDQFNQNRVLVDTNRVVYIGGNETLKQTMRTFVSLNLPSFEDSPTTRRLWPTGVREEIWGLHSILANPGAAPAESRRARREMLKLLEKNRTASRLRTIVPPLVVPPAASGDGVNASRDEVAVLIPAGSS